MAAANIQVMMMKDTGSYSHIKVIGAFPAQNTSNNIIVQANTLFGANTSAPCWFAMTEIQHATSIANGYIALYWAAGGSASNTDILYLGESTSSVMSGYMFNPLAANSANLVGGLGGDLGLRVQNLANNDTFSLIITIVRNAQQGYANAEAGYQASDVVSKDL